MAEPCPQYVPFDAAQDRIRDADLLLFRGRGLIAAAGRSVYSHAAMAAWWGRDLFCLEVREWYGGRAVTLESQVRRRPQQIDVYRVEPLPDDSFFVVKAVQAMRRLAGCDYGWASLWGAALRHLPLVRLAVSADRDDDDPLVRPPFCSQAVAWAYRQGHLDPVPNLADRLTEPADLARSPYFRYRFTLTP